MILLPILIGCKSIDHLRIGVSGKNLLQIMTFGEGAETIDLNALKKVSLKGFSINDFSHPLVHKHLRLYEQHGKRTIENIMKRGVFYLPTIKRIFREQGIPEELAYLPVIESGYRNKAISSAAAVGMWQFTYDTGIMYNLRANYWYDERSDFYKATLASAYHLKYLYRVFDDWLLTLAAYNAGVGKISRAIKRYKTRNFWELIENSYIKGETANYVPKYIAMLTMLQNPSRYKLTLPEERAEIIVHEFVVEDATEIALILETSGMSQKEFTRYNPSLLQWATPPQRTYTLYIPEPYYQVLKTNLAKIPTDQRVTFREYFIRIGDNLSTIAKRYDIPSNPIAEINHLESLNDIRAGDLLILPIAGRAKVDQVEASLAASGDAAFVTLSRQAGAKRISKKTKTRLSQETLSQHPVALTGTNTRTEESHVFLHLLSPTDTLYGLARRYNVELGEIMRWNGLTNSHTLRPYKHLIIYMPPP